jgi:alpha-glucosidase (family GH31 glycosyl hydrolase)
MYKVKKEGGAIVQPLAFEYPKDDNAFNNMDSTFMLGDAIYVTPALLNSSDNYDAYFPKGNWVNLFDLSNIIKSEGAKVSLKPQ